MTYFKTGSGRKGRISASRSRHLFSGLALGVSGLALMAALLASSGAQAQCTAKNAIFDDPITALFPLGTGGGVNALTSVIDTVNTAFLTSTSAFVSAPSGVAPDQQGGGEWARGIGGWVETKATGVFNGSGSFGAGVQFSGSSTCQTKVRQDYGGFQVGHDIAALNDSTYGANWHFGITGGYVGSYVKDVTPAGPPRASDQEITSPAGSLTADFQAPFAGLYAAFSKGNFYADGQAVLNYYQSQTNDSAGGVFNQRLDARGYSLTGNIGYRFDLAEKWFIEPSLGGVFSHTSVDPFNIGGVRLKGNEPTDIDEDFVVPGTVQIHDFDSELGRASVRVGTTIATSDGTAIAQPFFSAGVYHEFAGAVTTALSTNYAGNPDTKPFPLPAVSSTGTLLTSRIGTYEQFGLGSTFQFVNTGWLGYARADYRTGDNIEGWNLNAGLRYQFIPEAHLESLKDKPGSLKDAPVVWTAQNWTGLYVGAAVGGAVFYEGWDSASAGASTNPDLAGVLAGGQAGYNYQIGSIVTGVEGDWNFTNARGGGKVCLSPNPLFFSCEADADQLGSLTARFGYTWGRALFYAKGGWAFGEVTAQGHLNAGTNNIQLVPGLVLPNPASTTNWANGWTIGAGMEFALTDRWSAKAEYMHYDLGSNTYTVTDSGVTANISTSGDLVRVGLNYHLYP